MKNQFLFQYFFFINHLNAISDRTTPSYFSETKSCTIWNKNQISTCLWDFLFISCFFFFSWVINMEGAQGTLYEGERFQLQFKFSNKYPFDSPEVSFYTYFCIDWNFSNFVIYKNICIHKFSIIKHFLLCMWIGKLSCITVLTINLS